MSEAPRALRSVEEHLAEVLAATSSPAPTDVALLDALDLGAAEQVVAAMQLPRFDNSAMDGYAVHRCRRRRPQPTPLPCGCR